MISDLRFEKRLASYALAGGAVLTMSSTAQASSIYTWVDQVTTSTLTLNGPGSSDFTISASASGNVNINPGTNNFVAGSSDSNATYANALLAGTTIGNSTQWVSSEAKLAYSGYAKTTWTTDGTNAFLGLQFGDTDGAHYGWARGSMGAGATSFHLVDWAYESNPNTSITTANVPEPSSLALLSLGVVGLLAWRRRNRKAS